MTQEKYNECINNAVKCATSGSAWNLMFELYLLKHGLKIVAEQPVNLTDKCVTTPIPVEGEQYTYQYPSWIVEDINN